MTTTKKGQRLTTKKTKSTANKITKTNLNSKAIRKCYSPVKANRKHPMSNPIQTASSDELFVLRDSSNKLSAETSAADDKATAASATVENATGDLAHFVQDCKEFDSVFEKIKFKEQFKKQYEAQLNSRMSKPTVEPLFNTFSVFSPLKDDQYVEIEPSGDNSPLIATPTSIAFANKVDMPCAVPYEELSYDLLSPSSSLSTSSSTYCDSLFDSPRVSDFAASTTNSYHIPVAEIDELKTTIGNTNSIFTPLTDDLNSSNFYIAGDDDDDRTMKQIDFNDEPINWIHLAPQAGDSCISLDFDELPTCLDDATEKLIKEISFGSVRSDNRRQTANSSPSRTVQNLNNSTISFYDSSKSSLDSYVSSSKSVKIPNHFSNLESEITKKPRISFQSSAANQTKQSHSSKCVCSTTVFGSNCRSVNRPINY